MAQTANDLLGVGLYTVPDAARLLSLAGSKPIAPARLRRWVGGYRDQPPIAAATLPPIDGQIGLSFRDLIECSFIAAFVRAGLHPRAVRLLHDRAKDAIGHVHPFSTEQFRTDGRTIYQETACGHNESALFDLKNGQQVFHRFVAPSFKDLDLENSHVVRWHPAGRNKAIVLDPNRSFGRPIDDDSGIPTATLATAADALGSPQAVARWYPVQAKAVRDAVSFEHRLAA